MEVEGTMKVIAEDAPDPVKQGLWKDILNLRDQLIHLQHVNQCLTHSENTVRQLQLENWRQRYMETALLEQIQVAEWALRLATESHLQKDKEILQLGEQNHALGHIVQRLRRHCREKHCCQLDYCSQSRAVGLTKLWANRQNHIAVKNMKISHSQNMMGKGFTLEQTGRVLDILGEEDLTDSCMFHSKTDRSFT